MFTKRLFQKAVNRHQRHEKSLLTSDDVNVRINVHYGVPSTALILAFDPIQRLLAIGTLDGRIKVIGGDNIEGLLVSPKLLPFKYLEFLQNQGFIVSITNDNDIQVWNLERRSIACTLQWESNVTAFSVISGSSFMYVGDENGLVSVLKYDLDSGQILRLHYELSSDSLAEATGVEISDRQPVVGLLLQPCSLGNRLLIAYELGLIILWDIVEAHVVAVRGDKVLQLKKKVPPNDGDTNIVDDAPSHDLEEKEISALCWASTDGSILAVGYIDGDILFWNTSNDSSTKDLEAGLSPNVVKLQLSSAEKRLPVIVLQWLDNSKSRKHREGQLLIYGGDEIGSEEVVTVLGLEWSSGMEAVKTKGRTDITLTGSFADMILIPSAGTTWSDANASLLVLSNPGRIHIYDGSSLSSSDNQSKKELPISALKFPATVPTVDPLMMVAELFHVYGSIEDLRSKTGEMSSTLTLPGNKKWPLTGGVSNHLSLGKDNKVYRLYVAGYQDGSVRIWDVTYPVFSQLCVLTEEANSKSSAKSGASLTAVDLCSSTLRLAVGSECGRVQLYNLNSNNETSFHFVTETKSEVLSSAQVHGPRCLAVFDLQKSGVKALKFMNRGTRLIVGYECSRIAVLDVQSSSVTFITDSISNCPLISVSLNASVHETVTATNESLPKAPDNARGEPIFVLTKDTSIYVVNSNNGSMISSRSAQLKKNSTAISMYVIEKQAAIYQSVDEQKMEKDDLSRNELSPKGAQGSEKSDTDDRRLDKSPSAHSFKELFVLLCCKDSLCIYPAKSLVQGQSKSIYKVKLSKPCCWTTIFRKDETFCGLVVFYQTGEMDIRSLPELELVKEFSVLSDLRWNVKANMERMISSTENSHIALSNGSEVAFISLLEGENDFRIPESLPSLHDEVLASAANAAISVSSDHKRKQGGKPGGILGGIVKGLRVPKSNKSHHDSNSKANFDHLEDIFIKNQIPEPLTGDEPEAAELSIDDIEIDEPGPSASTSSHEVHNKNKDKRSEREKLIGDDAEIKPRLRTKEEIIAKYRKAGDAASAAGQARDKLLERQEKLERISRRTEDLRNGAEDFSSLANELVKAMENRKWYHI